LFSRRFPPTLRRARVNFHALLKVVALQFGDPANYIMDAAENDREELKRLTIAFRKRVETGYVSSFFSLILKQQLFNIVQKLSLCFRRPDIRWPSKAIVYEDLEL